MHIVDATEAKNTFGKIMNRAQRHVIQINKHDMAHVYVMSAETFNDFMELRRLLKKVNLNGLANEF
jgi:prevent-host-death family protein